MKKLSGLLAVGLTLAITHALAAQPAPAPAPAPVCKATLWLGDKLTRTLSIEKDKLAADGNNLTLQGEVYTGFLASHQARLKITPGSVQGNLDSSQVMLTTQTEQGRFVMRGTIGKQRVNASVGKELITLSNQQVELKMALLPAAAGSKGEQTFKDQMGAFHLTLEGCTDQILEARPEALLALHQIVLQRAAEQYKKS